MSLKSQKSELSLSAGYHSHQKIESPCFYLDHRPHTGKNVSLIAFRQNLLKILSAADIFSNTTMNNLEILIGNKSFHKKLSSRIIAHSYCPITLWKILGLGQNTGQKANSYSFSWPEKSSLIIYILRYQKCHSFTSYKKFSSNHPIQALLVAAVIAVVSYFLTSGFMRTYVILILINWYFSEYCLYCLWNS